MHRIRTFALISLLLPASLNGQLFQKDYSTMIDTLTPEKSINMKLLASIFFNNNEYFNPYQEGYTLIGGILQPSFSYTVNQSLSLTAGVHFRKYFGTETFLEAEPILNLTYIPNPDVTFIFGSFEGGQNHQLPETLSAFEYHFTSLVENGFLLKISKPFLNSEAWLDWQTFIKPNDPFREEFTAGITNLIKVYDNHENFHIKLPVFFLAHHAGGQINDSDLPVESVYNLAEGLYFDLPDFPVASGISPYFDLLLHQSFGDYSAGNGFGVQLTAGVRMVHVDMNAGFFHGNDFMSYHGLPLYTSYKENPADGYTIGGSNNLLSMKAGYLIKITSGSFLCLRGEGYYNPEINKFDYTIGVHMQFKDFFGLTGTKRNE